MLFDLHSHSYYSDGSHAPEFVLERARHNGVTHLAITDHDCIEGSLALRQQGFASGITLINGVEISTLWENLEIHVIGLGFSADHAGLLDLLKAQQEKRWHRIELINRSLEKAGISGLDAYFTERNCVSPSRSHVAGFLRLIGKANSHKKAFKSLAKNGRFYAKPDWCSIPEAIDQIQLAGGLAVVAHPHRYPLSNGKLKRLLVEFKKYGGDAMEVSYSNMTNEVSNSLGTLSNETGLWASAGSDFHDSEATWMDLGRIHSLPDSCNKNAIWMHPRWHIK